MHFIGFVVLVSPFKCIFKLKYMHKTPNSNRLTLWISEQGVRRLASLRCENGHVGCQKWSESRIGWFSSCLLGPLRLAGKARDCAIGVVLGVFELPKSSRSNLFLTFPGVLFIYRNKFKFLLYHVVFKYCYSNSYLTKIYVKESVTDIMKHHVFDDQSIYRSQLQNWRMKGCWEQAVLVTYPMIGSPRGDPGVKSRMCSPYPNTAWHYIVRSLWAQQTLYCPLKLPGSKEHRFGSCDQL